MELIRWRRKIYIVRKRKGGRNYYFYLVPLPREWVTTNSLDTSREVEIVLNADGSLTITPVKK